MCRENTKIYIFHERTNGSAHTDEAVRLYMQPHEILNTNSSAKRRTKRISACIKVVIVAEPVANRFDCTQHTHTLTLSRRINNKRRWEMFLLDFHPKSKHTHTHMLAHMMTIHKFGFFRVSSVPNSDFFVLAVIRWRERARTVLHIQVSHVCVPRSWS